MQRISLYKEGDNKIQPLRPSMQFLKDNYPVKENLIGAEIGVYKGLNAESMLENLNIKTLYLVDPYMSYPDFKDGRGRNLTAEWLRTVRINTRNIILKRFENKTEYVYKTSVNGVNFVPDELDFVYIDGNHLYDYVMTDIKLYYPKVKKGGIVGGHDYNDVSSPEVNTAVDEFVKEHNLKLYNAEHDWWVIKE